MKKIWNALRYGDGQTRKCIGSVLLFAVLGIGFIIVSGLIGKFGWFVLGMVALAVAVMLSQTFTLVDDNYVAQVNEHGKKQQIQSFSVKKRGEQMTSREKENQKERNREPSLKQIPETVPENEPETISKDMTAYDHYDKQVLKKIQKKYHVRKDHRAILIDSSKTYRIKECPAFIWRVHNKVHLLLIEKEPRHIVISRDLIRHMGYVPDVSGDKTKEYLVFQKNNLITNVFGGLIPDYYPVKNGKSLQRVKHLYEIYPDIRISNKSAATVMDLLCLNFMPDNKITQSEKLNGFFKRIYASYILYQDKVYSITEYKESVETILKEMCYAEIPMREFEVTLENLVKGHMISMEYASYYTELKQKIKLN